ncbi:MAG: FHA domain-containing protein [Candidatus Promineifilaceae bacterium]|jgi:pSer/pThr/pTyr-binding forkhead associated (FHA) protein|nr:FHA domain-containing protein [Chloroflexota bacterium]MBK8936070.1 FHA domain-containing protein [Chloroflexota bacterium]
MDPLIVLFLLRLLAAVLLLGFFGLFAWLIYQDVLLTKAVLAIQQQATGSLRVIKSESGEPAPDTMYALRPLTSIGRAKSSTILLDDGYVSSEHVLITQRHGQWWLEDLGSRNGTLLNGAPLVETAVISAGDVITIGGTDLKVEL